MPDWSKKLLRVSLNKDLINKDTDNSAAHGSGFHPYTVTPDDLATAIKNGLAYSYEFETHRRSKVDFVASDILSIDIDSGLTWDEALEHQLIQQYATILYTTPSHTPEEHRFRIIFALERTIEDPIELTAASLSLCARLGGDQNATDPARLFYGNSDSNPHIEYRGISSEYLDELIEQSRNTVSTKQATRRKMPGPLRSDLRFDLDMQVRASGGSVVEVGSLPNKTAIHCPYHSDRKPSAAVYDARNGSKLIHCFACNKVYYSELHRQYHFDEFVDEVLRTAEDKTPSKRLDHASVILTNSEFLDDPRLVRGLNFIRSPKGSGKTQFLSKIASIEPNASILLIGHRQALIRNACKRLGIHCYLDKSETHKIPDYKKRFGVCVDSLGKFDLSDRKYDYVIIDESEQVLSHFLGGTLKDKRYSILYKLQNIINKSDTLVALDADMSFVSFDYLSKWATYTKYKPTQIVMNSYVSENKRLLLFHHRNQMLKDLCNALDSKQKCYIASNRKNFVDDLTSAIRLEYPDVRLVSVTSDTSKLEGDDAGTYVFDPVNQSRLYDCVLATPVMSTGVDIRFSENETYFDNVYGFFDTMTTDHFECDQQISRVRHPGMTKLHISGAKLFFDTNLNSVRGDLAKSDMFGHLQKQTASRQETLEGDDDELLDLASAVNARRRASINDLKGNFVEYKRRQGWQICEVAEDQKAIKDGKEFLKSGKKRRKANDIDRLMSAPKLSEDKHLEIIELVEKGCKLSRSQTDQLERADIEFFYDRTICEDLIKMDDRGNLRKQVELFERVIIPKGDFTTGIDQILKDPKTALIKEQGVDFRMYREALRQTPVFGDNGFIDDVEFETRDLDSFRMWMKANRQAFEMQTGVPVSREIDKAPVKQLQTILRKMKLNTKRTRSPSSGGNKTYYYTLDSTNLKPLLALTRIRQNRYFRNVENRG